MIARIGLRSLYPNWYQEVMMSEITLRITPTKSISALQGAGALIVGGVATLGAGVLGMVATGVLGVGIGAASLVCAASFVAIPRWLRRRNAAAAAAMPPLTLSAASLDVPAPDGTVWSIRLDAPRVVEAGFIHQPARSDTSAYTCSAVTFTQDARVIRVCSDEPVSIALLTQRRLIRPGQPPLADAPPGALIFRVSLDELLRLWDALLRQGVATGAG
jgi:hypothetical protein